MSDLSDLLEAARRAGCKVTASGREHWRIVGPNGERFYLPSTPGGRRYTDRFRSGMRRLGFVVDPRVGIITPIGENE